MATASVPPPENFASVGADEDDPNHAIEAALKQDLSPTCPFVVSPTCPRKFSSPSGSQRSSLSPTASAARSPASRRSPSLSTNEKYQLEKHRLAYADLRELCLLADSGFQNFNHTVRCLGTEALRGTTSHVASPSLSDQKYKYQLEKHRLASEDLRVAAAVVKEAHELTREFLQLHYDTRRMLRDAYSHIA